VFIEALQGIKGYIFSEPRDCLLGYCTKRAAKNVPENRLLNPEDLRRCNQTERSEIELTVVIISNAKEYLPMTNGQGLKPSWGHTIVLGGLTVGVLDCIAAMVNAGIRGVTPDRVWQYVASSLVGPSAFELGYSTVALGLGIHFGVAFGVATAYYILARLIPALIRNAVISGIIYGTVVYFAMAYAIVPFTLVRQGQFNWYGLISGLIIHTLFVGLPVALITKRFAK
jgi:hypothetical protein